ncbi:hypothetical protein JCM21714_4170 [Gracilibacillus boraciitolerans JCM 21714]|uniref:Uncharacterized protein n=1 Tax=Gracilibacillus boraciitolerans JCM 21714 TaxID=1298598 RepID=W4VQE2_9BACI|nr:hypothetical protein [Gracilibacillus boraciitolerans]GAE94969.1 hypothetical protein JCM21714_4170 [Gracilibacillus boraciitolerans JCM 21714]
MVTSLYMVSLTILLTFLVLSVAEKIFSRRKKLKVEMQLEPTHAQVKPAIAGKEMR